MNPSATAPTRVQRLRALPRALLLSAIVLPALLPYVSNQPIRVN